MAINKIIEKLKTYKIDIWIIAGTLIVYWIAVFIFNVFDARAGMLRYFFKYIDSFKLVMILPGIISGIISYILSKNIRKAIVVAFITVVFWFVALIISMFTNFSGFGIQ